MAFGLYIHVPFCRRKCPYCDFYSRIPRNEDVLERYKEAVQREILKNAPGLPTVTSVYFGGGTPNLLGAERIGKILQTVGSVCHMDDAEITVECNPESVTAEDFFLLARAGANRISMGVQSAVERERRALGRVHSNEQVLDALGWARSAGIENISLDFMLGIPFQTGETLEQTLAFLRQTQVPHLSLYLLTIEEGTPFAKKHPPIASEDEAADFYETAARRLVSLGYRHYEISNFARPGAESRHNLTYWRCEEYLGIGPGAQSYQNGRRFYNPQDLNSFLDGTMKPVADGPGGGFFEQVMLGLRLAEGIDLDALNKKFTSETRRVLELAKPLEQQGFVSCEAGRLRLTPRGFLVSNSVISNLLQERD